MINPMLHSPLKTSGPTSVCLFTLMICLLLPSPVWAKAGVPMIFLSFPVMLVALLPIIFLEGCIYKRKLETAFKDSLSSSAAANALSTLGGFPLAWGLLLIVELITTGGRCGPGFDTLPKTIWTAIVESAWLCPWQDPLYRLIPVAFINSLVVAFFLSVSMERLSSSDY